MKEEAPNKKLPPKTVGGDVSSSTPIKAAHDEILSSLLRLNNFDSISSIKDESLDIDLSACVTISPGGVLNGNSLSSADFWRALDESAQNTELLLSESKEDLSYLPGAATIIGTTTTAPTIISNISNGSDNHSSSECVVTFLRPEPPNAFTNSPFKRSQSVTPVKDLQTQLQRSGGKAKFSAGTSMRKVFKEEPPEDITNDTILESTKEEFDASLISSAFGIFKQQQQQQHKQPKSVATKVKNISPLNQQLQQQQQQNDCEKPNDNTNQVEPPEIKVLPIHKCLDCNGLVLDTQDERAKHEALSHRTRLFYKCGECEREFDMLPAIKKHVKTHRTEARKDVWKKCPDCGKCLKLGSMWMHRKIHSDNKKYSCEVCGQKFVQKINLTHHARMHSSEKPYECPECQKRFQERSHLQRHQKYHAQTRSYRCDKCGKMYKTERCLKVHNLVHLEQRPFACNVCDKSFISNSKLKQHSNIHTGMRPFKCNYCPRDFTNFPNWLKHTRRRHKVDHKTGEHLENIPSYCSKKSTTKAQKAAAEAKEQLAKANAKTSIATSAAVSVTPMPITINTAATFSSDVVTVTMTTANAAKPAVKPKQTVGDSRTLGTVNSAPTKSTRKKKQPTALFVTVNTLPLQETQQPLPVQVNGIKRAVINNEVHNTNVALAVPPPKQTKVKRERKQLTPKQVQKTPLPKTIMATEIKKEPLCEPKETNAQFLDLHGLSLTSAEELIMEQALEMEECGLYDTPAADIVTDNAISSEAAAALHFQVKHEISDDKEEEFMPLSKSERLACPSLESSPFSSPASIELSSGMQPLNATCATNNYYMPTFSLNAQGAIVTHLSAVRGIEVASNAISTTATTLPALLSTAVTSTTTAMNVPLLVRSNQMLPSVDTLLFSTNAGPRFFAGKSAAVSTQQNLTS